MLRDPYQVLGVSLEASDADIKAAYRRQARETHPDRNPGDVEAEERFKALGEAYERIKDAPARKRLRYARASDDSVSLEDDMFNSIFAQGFSARSGRGTRVPLDTPPPPGDLLVALDLEFEHAARGCTHPVEVQFLSLCQACAGRGVPKGCQPIQCGTCSGRGRVSMRQSGIFVVEVACPNCRGAGQQFEQACHACGGEKRVSSTERLTVHVPPGLDAGDTIRVSGKGHEGGGGRGDLYLSVSVRPSETFERSGLDTRCEVTVPLTTAALGGYIEAPALRGPVRVEVPAGLAGGDEMVLEGQGIESPRGGGVGRHIIRARVAFPKKLTPEQRSALEHLQKLGL